jgi:hypothetical protein
MRIRAICWRTWMKLACAWNKRGRPGSRPETSKGRIIYTFRANCSVSINSKNNQAGRLAWARENGTAGLPGTGMTHPLRQPGWLWATHGPDVQLEIVTHSGEGGVVSTNHSYAHAGSRSRVGGGNPRIRIPKMEEEDSGPEWISLKKNVRPISQIMHSGWSARSRGGRCAGRMRAGRLRCIPLRRPRASSTESIHRDAR